MTTKKTTKSDKPKRAAKGQAAAPVDQAEAPAATPAPAKTKAKKANEPKAKKASAIDAAVRVLEEAGQPRRRSVSARHRGTLTTRPFQAT
jgi:hypothetical protein